MSRLRDYLLLIGQFIVMGCLLLILANSANLQQQMFSTPVMSEKPASVEVDEEKLVEIVKQEIGKLPKPADGVNGNNGRDGKDAVVDYNHVREIIQDEVSKLPVPKDGNNGENGADGMTPEFRTNPFTGLLEWRYVGDDAWRSTNTCGALLCL